MMSLSNNTAILIIFPHRPIFALLSFPTGRLARWFEQWRILRLLYCQSLARHASSQGRLPYHTPRIHFGDAFENTHRQHSQNELASSVIRLEAGEHRLHFLKAHIS
jgi:hypothetical protein